jgi:fibronectin-binding autotransporter adhesin
VGNGDGGYISLGQYSAAVMTIAPGTASNGVNGIVSANAGATGGHGGRINIGNSGRNGGPVAGGLSVPVIGNVQAVTTYGDGSDISLYTDGTLTLSSGVWSAGAVGEGYGGDIQLNGGAYNITGGGNLLLQVNGAGSGKGGYVEITAWGPGAGAFNIGSGSGQISIEAMSGLLGGDGGEIYMDGQNCTIDLNAIKMMPRGPEGSGDYIELDITGSITGNLDISGKGSGDGGGFYSYGSGGNLTIDANIIANSGANGGWGGGFDVEGGGNVTASGSFLANGVEGGGWHYWGPLGGNSVMTLTSGTVLEANGTGVNAPGGEIMVGAEHVGVSGGGTAYIRANGTAAGGYVDIESWDTIGDVTIGSVNGFTVEATGGANHEGGSMYVYAGRNVTVEGPAINLAGGTYGGWLALESSGTTQGNLQISGDLSLANTGTGAGGDLELVYRSTNPFVIGGALTESGITGSINVSSAYGTGGTVYLHNQAASGVNLVMNGTIDAGSSNHNNFGTITLSTQGQAVSATGTGTMIGLLDATGTSVNLNLTGAGSEIQVARAVATAGSVTLIASGADSSIFIPGDGANVTATTTISIASPTFASQRAISSSGNGDISISADSVSYSTGGSINAGTGNVSITPLNNTAMLVGAGTDVDGLHLSQVELEAITASRLTLGDITKNGSITINGSFDTSGAGAGAYDLVFNTAGTYTGTGHTITIGTNTYALDATGGGFLGGISGGATTVTVNSGADLTIDGAIAAPGGAISITGANAGSILSGGGSLTATDVTLTSTTGSIGTAADPIDTFATNLQANTDGSIYLNQTGAVNMQASSAGATGTFSLNITGGIFTPVGTVSGDTIRFTTDSTYSDAGTNLLSAPNIFITSTGGDVNLTAGYSATGSITLSAPNGGVNSAEATVGLDTPNLTITSGAGGVDVALTTATTLNVTSSGGVVITDTANSLITGAINAPSIDLTMPNADSILTTTTNAITLNTPGTVTQTNTGAATVSGSVGSLNLTNIGNLTAGVVTAVNSVTYTTSGAGSVLSGTGVTTADTLTINSAEDVSLDTAVLNLNLNMAGAVATIDNTGDVTTGSVVADAIDITTSGNLTMGAAINVPNSLQLVSTGGDITQIAGTLTADTAVITASNGNIGASGAAISIDFNQLTANAANGSAYFDQNGALTVGGNSGALNDFEINVTGGGLTNNQILSGNNLVFSSNGDVVVSGTGQINATGTIQFNSAAGLVNVNQTAFGGTVGGSAIGDFTVTSGSALVVGNVDGANVNLFTTNATINGAVSANAGNVLIQNSGNLSVGGTGSLSATGDNILRAGAGNTLNLSGTLSGSSFTTDARTVNNTGAITSNGDFNFTNTGGGVMTIANTGTLASSTGAINLTNAAGIVVNGGTGVLNSATTITATATNGAVDVTQNTIDGNIGGTAGGGNFSVTTTASDLNVTNTTARTNVSLTSALDLNVSAGASLTAGTMNGAANPTSTNMADYNINAIVAPGAVTLRAVTGDIDLAAGSQLQSRGGNVWMRADQNITSTNASFFAQAGNVEMCADNGAINITGGTMTAVARSNPANPNVNIDGHSIPYFQGGGVGIFSGVPNIDMGAALWSDQMARVSTGSMNMTGGVTTTGSTFNYTQNAGSINFLTQGGGTISAVASSFTASGGVIQVDPPTDITINGLTVTAVAPALTPPVPPIPPGPTPVLIVIPPATPGAPPAVVVTTVATVVSPVQSPATTILPTDATKEVTTYTPIVGERVCVPVVMAQQSDAGPEGWNIAAGACQSFAFQSDDGTTIAGTGGTAVRRTGANQVEMRNGKLVTMTGKEELSVTTSAGVVTLPAGSAAIIDESKQGVLRVEYLNGNPATVKVTGKDGKTSIVNAERGQEVVIADSDADDEDLIPVDGVERIAVEARLQFSGVQVRKNKFDREVLIAKDPLVNCNAGCLPTQVRNKMKKLKDDISATKPTKDTIGTTPTSPFRPVAQISPVATAAKLNRMSTGKASMCYGSNALISSISDDSVDLHEGEMLITVDNKVSVRTPQGVVALAPNTVALIRCKGDLLSASIMYEEHARSAQFVSHGKAVHIAMGGELVATTRAGVLDKFIKDDDVGRRRVRQADMPNGGEVMTSEVPFLSLLGNSSVLRGMFKSELEDDQELCSKLRKAAVAISVVTARHGSYAPVQPR